MIACIYHGGCPDGFAAAWVLRHRYPEEEILFYPSAYRDPLPDFGGRRPDETYVLDFSWPYEQMVDLAARSVKTILLDHHQSTLDDFSQHHPNRLQWTGGGYVEALGDGLFVELDMKRSGAMMTWDYLFEREAPPLIAYVQDRDLWRYELEDSRKVSALILSLPHDFGVWDSYADMWATELHDRAQGAWLFEQALIESLVPKSHWCAMFSQVPNEPLLDNLRVFPIVNAPYKVGSAVAERLMDHYRWDMAGYWLVGADGLYQYGVRSRDGVVVHRFAEGLGGGGHKQAAGFKSTTPEQLHIHMKGSGVFELPREVSHEG